MVSGWHCGGKVVSNAFCLYPISRGTVRQRRETSTRLSKLKNGKAPGSSDIVPEMLKVRRGDDKFIGMLWDLIVSPRREGSVPKE